jgi:hypothetical protein
VLLALDVADGFVARVTLLRSAYSERRAFWKTWRFLRECCGLLDLDLAVVFLR